MKLHYAAAAMPRSLRDSMNEILGQRGHRPASNCASMSSPAQRIVDQAPDTPALLVSRLERADDLCASGSRTRTDWVCVLQGILPLGRVLPRNPYPHPTPNSQRPRRSQSSHHWSVYGCKAPSDPIERAAAFHVIKRFESNWGAPPHLAPIVKGRRRANSRHGWRKRHGLNAEALAHGGGGHHESSSKSHEEGSEEDDETPFGPGVTPTHRTVTHCQPQPHRTRTHCQPQPHDRCRSKASHEAGRNSVRSVRPKGGCRERGSSISMPRHPMGTTPP